jgi:CheY-like chemotaxis protein
MGARILVVDPNAAFATMLEEMLEQEGGYEVEVTHNGTSALDLLRETDYDLTIVDMDLHPGDMDYLALIRQVRRDRPSMRLVLIPWMDEDLPATARDLNVQGILSKPFFADDLLPSIEEALSQPLHPQGSPPATALHQPAAGVQGLLSELARETSADAVLLFSDTDQGIALAAHHGTLDAAATEALANLSAETIRATRAPLELLGRAGDRSEHSIFESSTTRIYILALPADWLLAMVTPVSIPLGTIRLNLRRVTSELTRQSLT